MRKYLLIAVSFFVAILFYPSYSSTNDKADHDCLKCHKVVTLEEAQARLKDLIPDLRVLDVRTGPVKGVFEVSVESRGQKGILYLDYAKELVFSGAIFNLKTRANLTNDRLYELNKVDFSKIPLAEAIVMGDKDAPKKVIVFTDPD